MLKCAGNDDIITMKADDNGDTVTFMFENKGASHLALGRSVSVPRAVPALKRLLWRPQTRTRSATSSSSSWTSTASTWASQTPSIALW